MAYVVRRPRRDDASALGSVHVRAWQAAYRGGLMPDAYLDGLSVEERVDMWREALATEPRPGRYRLVAEGDGAVVGFVVVGPADGEEGAAEAEVYAINVDPDHWGRGAGGLLLAAGVGSLAADGYREAVLWVHPENARARRFYESKGWSTEDVTRVQEVLGVEVPEVRYRLVLHSVT